MRCWHKLAFHDIRGCFRRLRVQSLALDPSENGDHGQVDDDSDHRDLERSRHGQNDVSPCLQLTHRMIESKVQGHLSVEQPMW